MATMEEKVWRFRMHLLQSYSDGVDEQVGQGTGDVVIEDGEASVRSDPSNS